MSLKTAYKKQPTFYIRLLLKRPIYCLKIIVLINLISTLAIYNRARNATPVSLKVLKPSIQAISLGIA